MVNTSQTVTKTTLSSFKLASSDTFRGDETNTVFDDGIIDLTHWVKKHILKDWVNS